MSDCIGIERCQPKVRCAVHQTTKFGTQGDMPEKWEIGTTAVGKHTGSLALRSGDAGEGVARRIEDERTSLCEEIGAESKPRGRRYAEDKASGRLMNIGLNSRESGRSKILLSVPVVTVDAFCCQPAVERIPVTDKKAACIRASLSGTLARRVRGKEAGTFVSRSPTGLPEPLRYLPRGQRCLQS